MGVVSVGGINARWVPHRQGVWNSVSSLPSPQLPPSALPPVATEQLICLGDPISPQPLPRRPRGTSRAAAAPAPQRGTHVVLCWL